MKMKTLEDLLVDQLKDLYSAENQLVKALPKMAKAASNPSFRRASRSIWSRPRARSTGWKKICEQLEVTPKGKKCEAMEGLIEEGKELMEEDAEPDVLDAGLIAAAQKVEHYEIASYGSARTWAELLGLDEAVELLQETLDEEKETDEKLTQLRSKTSMRKPKKVRRQGTETDRRLSGARSPCARPSGNPSGEVDRTGAA